MAQILNIPDPSAQLASMLGQSLGTGLQQLAQSKLEQLQQKQQAAKTATGLQALGFTPQEAENLSLLPPNIQSDIVKNYLQAGESAGIEQALAQIRGEEIPETSGIQALMQSPTQGISELQPMYPSAPGIPEEISNQLQTQLGMQPTQAVEPSQISPDIKEQRLKQILQSPRLSPEQKIKLEQLRQKQRQYRERVSIEEQKDINKETLPFYKDVIKDYKGAKENERRLGRMEQLVRKGKLNSPIVSSILDTASKGIFGFGLNLDALRTPDSQEFKKLSTEFLKNAKALFGNRVTDNEIKLFMQMVPTLNQSDKGKLRVINNMKAYNQAELLKKRALDQVIEQNNGKRPRNLESLVEKIIEPELDKLSQEFKSGYNIESEPVKEKSSFMRRGSKWLGEMPLNL